MMTSSRKKRVSPTAKPTGEPDSTHVKVSFPETQVLLTIMFCKKESYMLKWTACIVQNRIVIICIVHSKVLDL